MAKGRPHKAISTPRLGEGSAKARPTHATAAPAPEILAIATPARAQLGSAAFASNPDMRETPAERPRSASVALSPAMLRANARLPYSVVPRDRTRIATVGMLSAMPIAVLAPTARLPRANVSIAFDATDSLVSGRSDAAIDRP